LYAGKASKVNLVPLNPKIEATCRKNNALRRRREHLEKQAHQGDRGISSFTASSPFPLDLDEPTTSTPFSIFVDNSMAGDEPQRVTLEDYSNSSTPQYFTSIVQAEVQAANISYPYSLIQLI